MYSGFRSNKGVCLKDFFIFVFKSNTMKKALLISIFLFIQALLHAQTYQWARSGGGAGSDDGRSITSDGSGNTYISGVFSSTATFGTFNLVGGGNYIAKYDALGNCLWAVKLQGNVNDIAGAYVTGWYAGTAVIGTTTLTSAGGTIDIFIAKFDQSTGNFLWAKSAGSNQDDDYGTAISFDQFGYPILTGYFWDLATFGTINLTGTNWETFIARYDATNGNCMWAIAAGGSNNQRSFSIQTMSNISYIVGKFAGTATIGTTTLTSNSGSDDIFIAKYDAGIPGWVWARSVGSAGQDEAYDIVRVNSSSDMYVTGIFSNSMTLGTTTLTSTGNLDAFTARIDANGNWVWAKSGGSATYYDYSNTITADNTGCYVAGKFQGTATFGTYSVTSTGLEDAFITHYSPTGTELWAIQGGGTGNDEAKGITNDATAGIVYATGTYTGTASFGSNNISAVASTEVFVTKICNVSANAGTDVSICNGGNTTLGASGGTSYAWSPTAGLSNPSIATPVASPTTTTNYTVTVTNSLGCTATDVVVVTVNPLPTANAGNDATICAGTPLNLSASGGISYTWSPAGSLSNPNISNPVATPTSNITYTVTVEDANTCTASDIVSVTVNSLPNANAGPDVGICIGNPTLLNASGGIAYSWLPTSGLSNPNVANPIASPTTTTIYTVTVTNSVSCSATNDVQVTVYQLPNVTANSSSLITCPGGIVALSATGAIIYSWSPTSGLSAPNNANTNATVNTSTTYTVSGTDGNGCSNTASVAVATHTSSVPDICMVTTDSASLYNEIYWDKTLNPDADSFIVYREVSTNVFKRIGAVSKDYSACSEIQPGRLGRPMATLTLQRTCIKFR